MYRHNILSLILTLQLRNLKLVSTFKETCSETKTHIYWKNIDCCYNKSKDYFQYMRASSSSDCQKLCDKYADCTRFFYSLNLNECYLSQCKNIVNCNEKLSIYPDKSDCPWMVYTKGLWDLFHESRNYVKW